MGSRQIDAPIYEPALWLTYITIAWMTVEGATSLLLGWASKSLILEAFGIDSVVELFSGLPLWTGSFDADARQIFLHAEKIGGD